MNEDRETKKKTVTVPDFNETCTVGISSKIEPQLKTLIEQSGYSVRQILWRGMQAYQEDPELLDMLKEFRQETRDELRNLRSLSHFHDKEINHLLEWERSLQIKR